MTPVHGGDGHLYSAAEVLAHDEWQRYVKGEPERPERGGIDLETVAQVVALQRSAS